MGAAPLPGPEDRRRGAPRPSAAGPEAPGRPATPRTGRARRPRRRVLAAALSLAVALVVTAAYLLTLPPTPPFHELWSKELAGNPFGDGATVDGLFVTYSYVFTDVRAPGASGFALANADFTFEAIDPSTGSTAWATSLVLPNAIYNGPIAWPQVFASGGVASLVVAWSSGTQSYLTMLSANATTGSTLAEWAAPIPVWAVLPPSEEVAISGGTVALWYPDLNPPSSQLEVLGFRLSSGQPEWNDSFALPGLVSGWGTGSAGAQVLGSVLLLTVTAGNPGSPGTILGLNLSNGARLFQRTISPSTAAPEGTLVAGRFYYLDNASNGLEIVGFSVATGVNTTPIPVPEVADGALYSAELDSVGGVLLVTSYSPGLAYLAFNPNGTLLWQASFPTSTSCGQPAYDAVGPCATDLCPPVPFGNGSVLLSSVARAMQEGAPSAASYRVESLSTGWTQWSAEYTFVFGQQFWPWQSPVPSFQVEGTVGPNVLYAVVSPSAVELAGGTT